MAKQSNPKPSAECQSAKDSDRSGNRDPTAELLYTVWSYEGDPDWEELDPSTHAQWYRLARYVLMREINVAAMSAHERFRTRANLRIMERLAK